MHTVEKRSGWREKTVRVKHAPEQVCPTPEGTKEGVVTRALVALQPEPTNTHLEGLRNRPWPRPQNF